VIATAGPAGVRIDVHVVPRASRTDVGGVRGGRLCVRVTAPPVDGAANVAVVDALAEAFGIPRRMLSVTAGATSRQKTIEIAGARVDAVQATLTRLAGRFR
jgi:uncharacterized protein (TIGR00251 family)